VLNQVEAELASPPISDDITISHCTITGCHNLLVQPDGEEHPLARSAFRLAALGLIDCLVR
jgi:hypothetical protein